MGNTGTQGQAIHAVWIDEIHGFTDDPVGFKDDTIHHHTEAGTTACRAVGQLTADPDRVTCLDCRVAGPRALAVDLLDQAETRAENEGGMWADYLHPSQMAVVQIFHPDADPDVFTEQ